MIAAVREDSDEAWMRAYAAGDPRALGSLFDRYAPGLLGFYCYCLEDRAAAEALLEETFTELHRQRRNYRRQQRVRPWLLGLAARVCLDALRRRSRPPAVVANDAVRAAVRSLDGSERVVLYLHRFEGMSFGEIAEVLGSSASEVRTQAVQTYGLLHERLWPLIERESDRGESP